MRSFVKMARAAAAAALFGLLFSASAPVAVHAQAFAQVVSQCGTPNQGSLPLGQVQPLTQDTTGTLCSKTGAGGAVATSYCYVSIKAVATSCVPAGHVLVGYSVGNENNSAPSFVQVFNLAPGSVTLGTTSPNFSIPMPTGLGRERGGLSFTFSAGATVACTTTETGSTAPTNNCDIRLDYQ